MPDRTREPIPPLDALRRIAFLLERSRVDTYKVKAFRGAADALLRLEPGELEKRHRDGTIGELAGIGPSTTAVITQALEGRVPDYLEATESTYGGPLVSGGADVLGALRGDLHSHSTWSDGGSPIEEMVATALELGHDYLAMTDHSPQLTVAKGLTAERLTRQLDVVAAINDHLDATSAGLRALTGIEVDILDDGALDQREDLLGRLDIVVASVHSKLRMDSPAMTRRMLAAVRNPHVDVLGHCTGRMISGGRGTRPPSQFDAAEVFAACAEHGVAVEINSRPERTDPPDDLIELALDAGCLFSIDSDAHAPGQLDLQRYGCERAQRLGVPVERIINTWDRDRLLDWAAGG